jgi:L-ascorbate metabolism protein UlaG (beta-lactamase superfamily)
MTDFMTSSRVWVIRPRKNNRYVIEDPATGDVLHDADGHGFKSYDSAYKYGYNQYHTNPIGYIEIENNQLF